MCRISGLTQELLDSARKTLATIEGSKDMFSRMMVMGSIMPSGGGIPLKVAERKAPGRRHAMIPGMSPEKALEMARKMGADEAAIKRWRLQ